MRRRSWPEEGIVEAEVDVLFLGWFWLGCKAPTPVASTPTVATEPVETGETDVPVETADTAVPDDTGQVDPSVPETSDTWGPEPHWVSEAGHLVLRPDAFLGAVHASSPELHLESEQRGNCRLMLRDDSCGPCNPGSFCVAGTCRPAGDLVPPTLDAGTITLQGTAASIEVSPTVRGGYGFYGPEMQTLGLDQVAVTTTGTAEVPALALSGELPPEIVPDNDWFDAMVLRGPAGDVELRWLDPVPDARIYLRMTTCLTFHGGVAHAEIECEGPDEGVLTLPGDWLDTVAAEGWDYGNCGGNALRRQFTSIHHDVRLDTRVSATVPNPILLTP